MYHILPLLCAILPTVAFAPAPVYRPSNDPNKRDLDMLDLPDYPTDRLGSLSPSLSS